jgi:hypothetical protein
MTKTTDKDFLVRFSAKYFFLARTSGDEKMHGTLYMSYGLRMSYLTACEVALRVRRLGWVDALVTNLNGDPISYENIVVEQNSPQGYDKEEFATVWNENVKRDSHSEIAEFKKPQEQQSPSTPAPTSASA